MRDEVGNETKIGDIVVVTAQDAGRGALARMFLRQYSVIGLGRTRIKIPHEPGQRRPHLTVGAELVKVIRAVDGRPLRSWKDVHQ